MAVFYLHEDSISDGMFLDGLNEAVMQTRTESLFTTLIEAVTKVLRLWDQKQTEHFPAACAEASGALNELLKQLLWSAEDQKAGVFITATLVELGMPGYARAYYAHVDMPRLFREMQAVAALLGTVCFTDVSHEYAVDYCRAIVIGTMRWRAAMKENRQMTTRSHLHLVPQTATAS